MRPWYSLSDASLAGNLSAVQTATLASANVAYDNLLRLSTEWSSKRTTDPGPLRVAYNRLNDLLPLLSSFVQAMDYTRYKGAVDQSKYLLDQITRQGTSRSSRSVRTTTSEEKTVLIKKASDTSSSLHKATTSYNAELTAGGKPSTTRVRSLRNTLKEILPQVRAYITSGKYSTYKGILTRAEELLTAAALPPSNTAPSPAKLAQTALVAETQRVEAAWCDECDRPDMAVLRQLLAAATMFETEVNSTWSAAERDSFHEALLSADDLINRPVPTLAPEGHTFYKRNRSWFLHSAIAAGIIGVGAVIYFAVRGKDEP